VIQSRILSEHPQYTAKVHLLHATLNCLMFSVCVVVWVILSTNSSPIVHLIVTLPLHRTRAAIPPLGESRGRWTVLPVHYMSACGDPWNRRVT
jgi:hypothetical protein